MSEHTPHNIWQHIIWRAEVLAYDGLSLILRAFPFSWISAFGGTAFRLIGPFTKKHHIAKTGLEIAFPDKDKAEIGRIMKAQWDNLGRTFIEFPLTHRIKAFDPKGRVTIIGIEKLYTHTPGVIISGHFANWEIMATVVTQSERVVRVTYRKINNPYMDRRIQTQRQKYGTQFLVQKSTHKGGRELFDALNTGESIAIMNDQKFNEGLSVPFFSQNAMTAPGAVRLARKTGRPLLPMVVVRDKSRFTVTIHDPIPIKKTADREADIYDGVLAVNRFIEARIHENPAQWFWVHRRWPKEMYK